MLATKTPEHLFGGHGEAQWNLSAWLSVSSPKGAHPAGEAETSARRQTPNKHGREAERRRGRQPQPLTGARSATPKIRLSLYKGMEVASGERGCGLAGPRKETHAAQAARDLSSSGERHSPASDHSRPHLTSLQPFPPGAKDLQSEHTGKTTPSPEAGGAL